MGSKLLKIFLALLVIVVVAALVVYAGGFMSGDKIEPGRTAAPAPLTGDEDVPTTQADHETITEYYEAVGTVRPRTENRIEAQVTGRVVEVLVRPGEVVDTGDRLIVLDSREYQARQDQAEEMFRSAKARREQAAQAVAAARAEYERAKSEYERFKRLFESKTISSRDLERTRAAFLGAQASLNQAADALAEAEAGVRGSGKQVEEAQISSGYTTIHAVEPGQVVNRLVDPGDLATPGKPLLVLQNNLSLRLEALVREGLIDRAARGTRLQVKLDSLGRTLEGTIEEIVPSADPQSRSFLVKVTIDNVPGLYPGMFGRLLVPFSQRRVVVAPVAAVRRIGQLDLVKVKTDTGWRDQFVRLGQNLGDRVEILSGLDGGEILSLDPELARPGDRS